MRVALIPHRYPPHLGGIERYAEELARGLARRGIDVDVLTPEPDASLPPVVEDGNLTIHRFHEPFPVPRYANAPALARRLRAGLESYDLVHVLNYHELVPLLAAFGNPQRLIVTPFYHPPVGGRAAPILRRLHHAVAVPATRRADQIICISSAEAEGFVREVPDVSDRVTVIPAGVDVDAIRRADPWDVARPVVLSVGRLVGYKRVARIVEAVALVNTEVDLVVVGDGPEAPALRAQAQKAEVAARFTGRLSDDDVRRWLRSASVVVTMSDRESFGLTVLEAAAAGARVVASDIPAHRETAGLGGAGRSELVPYEAGACALRDAIARAVAEGRPQAAAENVPTWDGMAGEVAEVYAAVTGRPSMRAAQPSAAPPAPSRPGWVGRHRDLIAAHLFVVWYASAVRERAGVVRFIGRQVGRAAGRRTARDAEVRVRGLTYVVDESAELHTLVELHRDGYYSRAPDFLPAPGTTVVDVGANVGVFTMFHAVAGADVLALEPNPAAYDRLTRAISRNGLDARVRAVKAAAGAAPGRGRLELADGMSVLGSVVAEPGDAGAVEIVRLDTLLRELGIHHVDLLKIDVEGGEADVLRGSSAALGTVRRVIVEYHSDALLAKVRAALAGAGFRERLAFPAWGDGAGIVYADRT